MAEHLGPNTLLSAQASDSYQARGHSAYLWAGLPRRVGEQTAVFLVYDEHGQVGVCVAQFIYELILEGSVYRVPQLAAACVCRLDI
jgi:hypothetical protein